MQYAEPPPSSPPLDASGTQRIQLIVGSLLYYARTFDNKLLVALSKIGRHQAAATEATNDVVEQLLDYVATYPNDGITYRVNDMVLAAQADAACLNVPRARSRAGVHIMLSEDDPIPRINGPVLTIAHVIKFVIS